MELINNRKEYNKDRGLVHSCQYHVIFSTKFRRKVISEEMSIRIKELIKSRQEDLGFKILEMEIMPDHVHLLLDSNPRKGIYNQVTKIKGFTSHVIRKEFKELQTRIPCMWTRSTFISSVGSVSLEVVKKYIEDQKNV